MKLLLPLILLFPTAAFAMPCMERTEIRLEGHSWCRLVVTCPTNCADGRKGVGYSCLYYAAHFGPDQPACTRNGTPNIAPSQGYINGTLIPQCDKACTQAEIDHPPR